VFSLMSSTNDIIISAKNLEVSYLVQRQGMSSIKQFFFSLGTKSLFERRKVLTGVSLEVRRGESIGLLGRNGSGKSTLLKALSGIIQPTSGELIVRGRIAPMLALGVGLEKELSGYENIKLCGTLMGMTRKEIDEAMDSIIEFSELGDDVYMQVKRYSSGMMARLSFAIAIAKDPEILMVDEALSVGDAGFRAKCLQRIHEVRERGSTILYVSLSPEDVETFCDRAAFLKNGKIHMIGTVAEVMPTYLKEYK
jgi:ABC-type polysaccharide/polyol phosphate transport system ATPase subunit